MSNPDDLTRAELYLSLGYGREALDALRNADPEDSRTFLLRARALTLTFDYNDALAAARRGLELDPESVDLLKALAILENENRPEDALKTISRALELSPDDVQALNLQAIILARTGRHDAAETTIRAAMALNPEGSETARVMLLLARGESAYARDAARRLIADNPESAISHHLLGNSYLHAGATFRGLRHLRLAAALEPENVVYSETARVMQSWYLWPAYLTSGYKHALFVFLGFGACYVTDLQGNPQTGERIFYGVLALTAYRFLCFFIARWHLGAAIRRAEESSRG